MEDKKNSFIVYILLGLFCSIFVGFFGYGIYMSKNTKESSTTTTTTTTTKKVTSYDEAVAVFHGGAGEQTYQTSIYKLDNGQANYGFKYVNETCTTKSWGSSEWECDETDTGTFSWTDEAFRIARANSAYSYVTVPGSERVYSINEFMNKFIMD